MRCVNKFILFGVVIFLGLPFQVRPSDGASSCLPDIFGILTNADPANITTEVFEAADKCSLEGWKSILNHWAEEVKKQPKLGNRLFRLIIVYNLRVFENTPESDPGFYFPFFAHCLKALSSILETAGMLTAGGVKNTNSSTASVAQLMEVLLKRLEGAPTGESKEVGAQEIKSMLCWMITNGYLVGNGAAEAKDTPCLSAFLQRYGIVQNRPALGERSMHAGAPAKAGPTGEKVAIKKVSGICGGVLSGGGADAISYAKRAGGVSSGSNGGGMVSKKSGTYNRPGVKFIFYLASEDEIQKRISSYGVDLVAIKIVAPWYVELLQAAALASVGSASQLVIACREKPYVITMVADALRLCLQSNTSACLEWYRGEFLSYCAFFDAQLGANKMREDAWVEYQKKLIDLLFIGSDESQNQAVFRLLQSRSEHLRSAYSYSQTSTLLDFITKKIDDLTIGDCLPVPTLSTVAPLFNRIPLQSPTLFTAEASDRASLELDDLLETFFVQEVEVEDYNTFACSNEVNAGKLLTFAENNIERLMTAGLAEMYVYSQLGSIGCQFESLTPRCITLLIRYLASASFDGGKIIIQSLSDIATVHDSYRDECSVHISVWTTTYAEELEVQRVRELRNKRQRIVSDD
ncbi:MAG: hypothetical protein QG604_513 [Candidatus Dependentiae bacterium]|nr:hypothetical protein [Candidatus Dependentiae bacterium]